MFVGARLNWDLLLGNWKFDVFPAFKDNDNGLGALALESPLEQPWLLVLLDCLALLGFALSKYSFSCGKLVGAVSLSSVSLSKAKLSVELYPEL